MGKDDKEKQTTYVYIMDDDHAWRPAILDDTQGDKAHVRVFEYKKESEMRSDGGRAAAKKLTEKVIDLKKYPSKVLPLQNVDNNGVATPFPDMVRLPYLHEAGILYNLKERHMGGHPYTRTGDIVIAVNPFQWFHDLYTDQKRTYYSNRLVWEASENDPRDSMDPHVYEVSSLSYKGLAFEHTDQSILVSGESGAGKTETVKICMNHMASVQRGPVKPGFEEGLDPVVQRVVDSNPLLEAFGNAKTRRNDNSSRFGKYLQLQFDNSAGKGGIVSRSVSQCRLAGSKCDVYLLEKNRITVHDDWERTYHMFYQILAAPDSEKAKYWDELPGTDNKSFRYVGHTDTKKIEGQTDAEHFENTVNTLALVGVDGDKLRTLMRAICVVLQCGNMDFGPKQGDTEASEVTNKKEADKLAKLMGVGTDILELAFTERTMKTRTESYKVPLKAELAKEAADSFAKEAYGKLFLWVVKQINIATAAEDNYKDGTMKDFQYGIIGLLDIFGFESFVVNRFEQLCINYANEKLQQKFTEDVFRAVQQEYEDEGIELAEISYDDNTDVLDLIEGRSGLLAMLNEECVRPKGNDQEFVQKALSANSKSPCLIVNKMDRMSFGVHHYAGKVMYDADHFVASNQDFLPTDLEELGLKCQNEILSANPAEEETSKKPKRQRSNLVGPTVWGKYKTQLASLMGNLRKTQSRYIRCIKPNMKKVPNVMEHIPTVEQLRCAGVVAAVTLARSAFPNRLDNSAVMFRYSSSWDKSAYPSKKDSGMTAPEGARCDCDAVMTDLLKCKEEVGDDGKVKRAFVCGRTKTYYRAGALEYLESNRQTGLDSQATTIQKYARGFITRKNAQKMGNAKKEAEEEARLRAEAEAKSEAERAAAEKAGRDVKRTEEKKKYEDKIKHIKKQIEEAEEYKQKKLADAEERKEKAEGELEQLRIDTSESARKALMEPKKLAAQQKKKLEEQTKLIEFLKKENKKIRKDHDKIQDKFDVVKANNDKLISANEDKGDNFEELNEDTGKVNNKNESLLTTLEKAKKENKKLKDQCMKRQDDYMTQAETRLEYQKTMARILNMIQETSKEPQVVEDTCVLALECEAESKSVMAALEAEVDM